LRAKLLVDVPFDVVALVLAAQLDCVGRSVDALVDVAFDVVLFGLVLTVVHTLVDALVHGLVHVALDVLVLIWLEMYVLLLHDLPPFELLELAL
jgi:hypothetical protein